MPRRPLPSGSKLWRAGGRDGIRSGNCCALVAVIMGVCRLWSAPSQGEAGGPDVEYQIKAVFLFNFAKFVDWPETAFPARDAPIVIGVVGESPFGSALEAAIKDETVKGRKIVCRQFTNESLLTNCNILFISRSEQDHIPALLEKLGKAPVLTVADSEGFTAQGGMINFVLQDNKIRFDINPMVAERAGMKISSRLLNLPKPAGANHSKEPTKP